MGLIIAAVGLALFSLYIFLLAPGRKPKNGYNTLFSIHYAHRGLHTKDGAVPENSSAAFEAAAKAGYGIELDVHITADGELIVFHDDDFKHICGVQKSVWECTYKELSEFRLLNTDEKIPLLSEVLNQTAGRSPLIVELKNGKNNKTLCEKTAALLDSYNGAYCIESFHPMIVRWFYKNRPQVVRGQLAAGRRQYKNVPFYQGVLLSALFTNILGRPHFVAYRHEDSHQNINLHIARMLGAKLLGWTARDKDEFAFCERLFDAVIFEFFMP